MFVLSGAITMALSIGAVGVSSYLTGKAERMAMEVDVNTAVALVRYRMSWVVWPYQIALLFLWACAALLVFATCPNQDSADENLCDVNGVLVVLVFIFLGGFVTIFPRWLINQDVEKAQRAMVTGSVSSPIAFDSRMALPSDRDMSRPLRDANAPTGLREVTPAMVGQGSDE